MRTDAGQAAAELVVGIFALALILSALLVFAEIIPRAAEYLSLVRVKAGRDAQSATGGSVCGDVPAAFARLGIGADPVVLREESLSFETSVPDFAAEHLFGDTSLRVSVNAAIPVMTIPNETEVTP